MPVISIIVPNYNHKPYLKQRLDTVFGQTYQNFEVILLDDASTDGSQVILETYRDHPKTAHLISNTQNSGTPFKQWKKGIELAKGDYIWIAESDDYCKLTFLEETLKTFNDKVGICYTQSIDVDEKGKELLNRIDYTNEFQPNIWKDDFLMEGQKFIKKYLLVKNVIPNASAVIFKRALLQDSIFSETLLKMKMCGDWFFWIKLSEKTNIAFVSVPFNYFRNHKATSRNHKTLTQQKQRLFEESIIRKYAHHQLGFNNGNKDKKLIKKWFKLHPLKAIFSSNFYKLSLTRTNKISLFLKFISFKFKK